MKNDLQDELVFMLRHDPHVRGGIMRFQNCCVNVSMNWKEPWDVSTHMPLRSNLQGRILSYA